VQVTRDTYEALVAAWWEAADGPHTYEEFILGKWLAKRAMNEGGSLSSLSRNSSSHSSAPPGASTKTTIDLQRDWFEAYEYFKAVRRDLDTTDEALIFAEIEARGCVLTTEVYPDFSYARTVVA
jgi:hypothetical protein